MSHNLTSFHVRVKWSPTKAFSPNCCQIWHWGGCGNHDSQWCCPSSLTQGEPILGFPLSWLVRSLKHRVSVLVGQIKVTGSWSDRRFSHCRLATSRSRHTRMHAIQEKMDWSNFDVNGYTPFVILFCLLIKAFCWTRLSSLKTGESHLEGIPGKITFWTMFFHFLPWNSAPSRNPISLTGDLGDEVDNMRATNRPRVGTPREREFLC